MLYTINNVQDASKILPWILENNGTGNICGQYDVETIHYGTHHPQVNIHNNNSSYQLFDRKGGVIVASPGDFYIISFSLHQDKNILVKDFINGIVLKYKDIELCGNDLIINKHKVAGGVSGNYKNRAYYAGHFSVNQVNNVVINKVCDTNAQKIPSCFSNEGYDFVSLGNSFLATYSLKLTPGNINISDNYITHDIKLPVTSTQESVGILSSFGGKYE